MSQEKTDTKEKYLLMDIFIEDYVTMSDEDRLRIINFYLSKML